MKEELTPLFKYTCDVCGITIADMQYIIVPRKTRLDDIECNMTICLDCAVNTLKKKIFKKTTIMEIKGEKQ